MTEASIYNLAYQQIDGEIPAFNFFIVLCDAHLAKRLTNGASVLEKRSTYPANEPCSDCRAAEGKLR